MSAEGGFLCRLDDLEDGDPLIMAANGRKGAWYTYNDESMGATQTPAADEPSDDAVADLAERVAERLLGDRLDELAGAMQDRLRWDLLHDLERSGRHLDG